MTLSATVRQWFSHLSLTTQLVLLAVLPAVLATLAVSMVATRQYLGSVEALIRANAQTAAYQIATAAEEPMRAMDRRALLGIARAGISQPQVKQVRVWSADGELLAQADEPGAEGAPGFQVTAPILGAQGRPSGQVNIKASLQELLDARQKRWRDVLVSLLVSLLVVLTAGAWAARRITAPVSRLGVALEKLGAGESTQVEVTGTLEIQRLLQGFNRSARALAGSRLEMETRIREATAELARKNQQIERASQARMRLLAAASHDLRQPLHALTLLSEGLASGEADPVRLQRIGHVRECVSSLDQLFSELLNLSQLDAGVLRPNWRRFALDQVFANVSRDHRPVAEERGLRLVVRPTALWVHSDFTMLSRILGNLVSNALRHTVTGGILVAARTRGAVVQIDVIDTGVGIPAELRERVFDEFYQADNLPQTAHRGETRGLGLGLATVRRLAHLLHTRVELKSVVGRGTCMRLRVKTCPPEPPTETTAAASLPPYGARLAGSTILVIDDEPAILEGLHLGLGGWGCHVLTARSRAEALAHMDARQVPPDVIICDLLLADGDNGLLVLAALAAHPHSKGALPARLLVTGETQPRRLLDVAASGIPVLYKPVTLATLHRAIVEQLPSHAMVAGEADSRPG